MRGFELADHSLGLVVDGGEDLVGVRFRAVKRRTADRESMTSWPSHARAQGAILGHDR